MTTTKRYRVAQLADIPALPCPCGEAKRAFTDDPDQRASFHITTITEDAKLHYHKKLTELYYVLEGEGHMELDGERVPLKPGTSVMIKPGCRHRAVGRFKMVIVAIPAFDPADEWVEGEGGEVSGG